MSRTGDLVAGRFRITGKLGAGGMATVYRAQDLDDHVEVALKIVHPEFAEDPEVLARFARETEITNALAHPNTLAVIAFGATAAGDRYLALELFEGDEVDELILEGPLPPHRVARIGSQICSVLQRAHDLGILHRDLTPANVLVAQPDDQVRVLDFGLAGLLERQPADAKLTAYGIHVGSPAYMAPEYLKNDEVDARTDLYSLGCLLFLLTCGRLPFTKRDPYALMLQHVQDDPPRACELMPECPRWLNALLSSLLAKVPEGRPVSAGQVKRILDASEIVHHPLSTATPLPPRHVRATISPKSAQEVAPPEAPPRKSIWWAVSFLALLILWWMVS